MTPDLHKRLEEAAENINTNYPMPPSEITESDVRAMMKNSAIQMAEYVWKEAVKVAKEWLETNIANQVEMMCAEGPLMMSKRTFLADFESEMLKFWEE